MRDILSKLILAVLTIILAASCGFDFDMGGRCFEDDPCNADTDKDGVPLFLDNCPEVANVDQKDTDQDGIGDACEGTVVVPPDTKDNDGHGSTDGEDIYVAEEVEETEEPDTQDTSDADTEFEDVDGADIPLPIDVEEDLVEPEDTQDEVEVDVEDVVEDTADTMIPEDADVPPIDPCEGIICNDNNDCTDDSCDLETGKCVALDNSASCEDGNPCTHDDICADAACVSGTNGCDCETTADCAEKNDPDLCKGSLVCSNTKCVVDPATIVVCEQSSDPCFEARCEPASGLCSPIPLTGESCDDDDHCTIDDVCDQAGECVGSTPLVCDDQNICTTDSCNPTLGCQFSNNLLPCEDGNLCTLQDNCLDGTCQSGSLRNCNDGNLCTGLETCNPETGDCVADPNPPLNCCLTDQDCFDDSECTTDTCHKEDGTCQNTSINCDDQDACTSDSCDPTLGCINADVVCNDDDECTTDVCVAEDGTCENTDLDCSDNNVCTADSCDPTLGCAHVDVVCEDDNPCTADSCVQETGCSFQELTEIPCTDEDVCTLQDHCLAGVCVYESLLTCGDDNVCTDDFCDPETGCMLIPNTSPCSDGMACTIEDTCADGACHGNAINCDDGNPCTMDACDPETGLCVHPPKNCDDNIACTADACQGGTCTHGRNDSLCTDTNPCTDNVCDPQIGCAIMAGQICGQVDTDGDGKQDAGSDIDSDGKTVCSQTTPCGDGWCDPENVEWFKTPEFYPGQSCSGQDNCPRAYNPNQLDTDGDGMGDACDPHP